MSFKTILKKSFLYPYVKRLKQSLDIARGRLHPIQLIETSNQYPLVRLGSKYGGWTFVDTEYLQGSTFISAGLGEDASFDVEFAKRYKAKAVMVDPTPRAIAHFDQILARVGGRKIRDYSAEGQQDVESYDLTDVSPTQLHLVEKALWNESKEIKFFQPTNLDHVSHSIVNFQNNYVQDTPFITVTATKLSTLIKDLELEPSDISLVKLDIEGAEIEVLQAMIEDGFLPRQLLIEYDELISPSKKGYDRVTSMNKLLKNQGYKLLHCDRPSNFLYLKPRPATKKPTLSNSAANRP